MDIGSEPTIINILSVDAYVLGVCDLISRTFAKIVALDPKVMEKLFSFQIRRTNNIFSSFFNSWIINIDILKIMKGVIFYCMRITMLHKSNYD